MSEAPVPYRTLATANAQYQAGLTALEQGRPAEAIAILSRIADRRDLPGTLARFYLGRAHLQSGLSELRGRRHARAIEHLQAAAAINPADADLTRYLAACYVGQGRFDLAAEQFEKQWDVGGGDADTPIRLALASWKSGRLEHGIDILLQSTLHKPQYAAYHLHLGLLHVAADDLPAAIESLNCAVRLAPLSADARQHLGLTLGATGRIAEAARELRAAHELRPQDAYLALQLAYAMKAAAAVGEPVGSPEWEQKERRPAAAAAGAPPDEIAMARLGEIIHVDPDFVEAFLALPQTGVDAEIYAVLVQTLERALERDPEHADLYYHVCRVYSRLGRRQDAILAADRALRVKPQFVEALIQLGRLYVETDRTDEAIDRLQEAIRRGGDYPDVHFLLGKLYRRSGDDDQARRSFQRALELNGAYAEARRALQELEAA